MGITTKVDIRINIRGPDTVEGEVEQRIKMVAVQSVTVIIRVKVRVTDKVMAERIIAEIMMRDTGMDMEEDEARRLDEYAAAARETSTKGSLLIKHGDRLLRCSSIR